MALANIDPLIIERSSKLQQRIANKERWHQLEEKMRGHSEEETKQAFDALANKLGEEATSTSLASRDWMSDYLRQKQHAKQLLTEHARGLAVSQTRTTVDMGDANTGMSFAMMPATDEAIKPHFLLGGSVPSEEEAPDTGGHWIDVGTKRMWMTPEIFAAWTSGMMDTLSHPPTHQGNAIHETTDTHEEYTYSGTKRAW